jgi:hypothetical protein
MPLVVEPTGEFLPFASRHGLDGGFQLLHTHDKTLLHPLKIANETQAEADPGRVVPDETGKASAPGGGGAGLVSP